MSILFSVLLVLLNVIYAHKSGINSRDVEEYQDKFLTIVKIVDKLISSQKNSVGKSIDPETSNPALMPFDKEHNLSNQTIKSETSFDLPQRVTDLGNILKHNIQTKINQKMSKIKQQTSLLNKMQLFKQSKIYKTQIANSNFQANTQTQTQSELQPSFNHNLISADNIQDESALNSESVQATFDDAKSFDNMQQIDIAETKSEKSQSIKSLGGSLGTNLCLMFIGFIMVIIA